MKGLCIWVKGKRQQGEKIEDGKWAEKKNFLHGIVDYINRVLARRGLFEESSVEC